MTSKLFALCPQLLKVQLNQTPFFNDLRWQLILSEQSMEAIFRLPLRSLTVPVRMYI